MTEFDELFKIGYKSLVKLIVKSAPTWQGKGGGKVNEAFGGLPQAIDSVAAIQLASSQ